MKKRYRIFRRSWGAYYCENLETKKQESLKTRDKAEAHRLVAALNETAVSPAFSLHLARVYWKAGDPAAATRTWQAVMEEIPKLKLGDTRHRWETAIRDPAFDSLRKRVLLETQAEHFLRALERGSVSTNIYLRRIHNFAMDMFAVLLGTTLLVLTALIFFSCRVGGTLATRPDSIPRRGISSSTIGVVRVDLAELRPNSLRELLVEGGVDRAEADKFLTGIERLRSTLFGAGITSATLPISYDLSAFDNIGVYLGGDERQKVEELESTLLRGGGGNLLGWTALMSSVTDVGYGWRFWGVAGDGVARSVDETRAKRLEHSLHNLPPAAVRLILLGETAGEIEPIDAGSPRLLRQLKRLRNASRGLIAMDLSLPRPADSSPMKPVASAVFQSEGDARAFHQAWSQLSVDLVAAAGPAPAAGPGEPLMFAMLQRLATATPSLSGTIVSWTPK